MNSFRVLCLGNVLVDVLARPVDALPEAGSLKPVKDLRLGLGGCAANTAVALGRLGVPVSLCGKVGRDVFGELARSELVRAGVDVSFLRTDPRAPTSSTLVLVDRKGERSFLHSLAANAELRASDLSRLPLRRFRHLHVGGYFLWNISLSSG